MGSDLPTTPTIMLFTHTDGSESPLIPFELAMLISDSLEAPATFLIVEQLSLALKAKRRCILVGTAQSFDHYAALLRKQGVQLPTERERGTFTYIDGLSALVQSEQALSAVIQQLQDALQEGSLVVCDDVSAFLYAGQAPVSLLKQYRRLMSLVRQSKSSSLCVIHDDAFSPGRTQIERSAEDAFVLRNLIQLSDVWVQTRSLRAQLTGELYLHRAPSLVGQASLDVHTLNRPLQYKLDESGAKYFAKGTGKGFL